MCTEARNYSDNTLTSFAQFQQSYSCKIFEVKMIMAKIHAFASNSFVGIILALGLNGVELFSLHRERIKLASCDVPVIHVT